MQTYLAVAAGGALGSLGRWSVGLLASGAAWATVLVNVTGAVLMGLLVGWLERHHDHPLLAPFAAVGLLGGWTTYSAFALDVLVLLGDDRPGLALGYVVGTLALGLVGCLAGLVLAERVWGGSELEVDEIVDEEEL